MIGKWSKDEVFKWVVAIALFANAYVDWQQGSNIDHITTILANLVK